MPASRLQVRVSGHGFPVVFLGGCPSPWDLLAPLAVEASRTHRAIEVALPGYAASPPLPGRYTLDAAHEAVETTLVAAGATECAIVGFSAGAYRALAIACRGRVRVTRILSLAGLAGLAPEEREGFHASAVAFRAGHDLRAVAASRFLSPRFAASHSDAVAMVESWLSAAPVDVLAGELEAFAEAEDLLPRLPDLRCRVVARTGSLDVAVAPAKSAAIAAACRGALLEVVEGAGHALPYEDPGGTAEALVRLLSGPRVSP